MKTLTKLALVAIVLLLITFNSCKKELITAGIKNQLLPNTDTSTKMVFFPGAGLVPANEVHLIEPGYYLKKENGYYYKMEKRTNMLIEDYGIPTKRTVPLKRNLNLTSNSVTQSQISTKSVPIQSGTNPNWVTYAYLENNLGKDNIKSFSTVWQVPSGNPINYNLNPSSATQAICIFPGLTDETGAGDVIQPVLQWGTFASGGGQSWAITCCYSSPGFYAFTTPQAVSFGQTITGVINYNGVDAAGNSNEYTCNFSGYPNQTLTVYEGSEENQLNGGKKETTPYIPLLNTANETLEAYTFSAGPPPTTFDNYPVQDYVQMTNINIQLSNGTTLTPLTWGTAVTSDPIPTGQQTVVDNNGNVDLYFHGAIPPILSYPSSTESYTVGTPINNLIATNNGGPATSGTISPSLPPGLSISPTTGVISGTPTQPYASANYTVTASNAAGSSSFVINITVNAPPVQIAYDFQVTTNSYSSSMFTLALNGVSVTPQALQTAAYNVAENINSNVYTNSNSTVLLTITGGYMPQSATLNTYLTGVNGIISGNTITFSGVNISSKQPSLSIVLN